MKRLQYVVMLAFVAMLTLTPAVRAEDLSDGGEPMGMEMQEMHEMMHHMMDGTMTPMEMHAKMHGMMDKTMLLPATGAPAGPVLVLVTALGLIGLGVLSRFGGQGVSRRYGSRAN